MKNQFYLSQGEMRAHFANSHTVIVAYKRAFEIQMTRGVDIYVLSPIPGQATGLPYTKRGRFHAVTPEAFRKLQLTERAVSLI